ncbi:eukaryotic translation initiation factor 3 subunit E [Gonapodya prolifera JEL478]|uniref:Eukaryotic translation initiation factor 3 subunit E n=1 Tax=Gonapodya prolifera (strain JEL478) TaxID=1344416 RepID=A0A138ZZS5_GONPJ|nr:eukaryotic translation initiation factor 3 subunit E [Gonapodya prolifera JEL478]|eukprot:KXS10016.1 eukaryotic translation initiation factor 3 subunit E [Gonapodya prolifera JEL478]
MANSFTAQVHDLTPRLIPNLDPHMVLPLLEFLTHHNLYPEDQLLEAKYDLLQDTKMIDFANDVHKQLKHGEAMPGFESRRQNVLTDLEDLRDSTREVMEILSNPDVIREMKNDKLQNQRFLEERFGFRVSMLDRLYDYARFQYACGNYSGAAEMLYHFRILSTDYDQNLSALWGKLAAEILTQNWETALEDLVRLREMVDGRTSANHLHQLQQRTWLLHWSLFVFFNHPKGRDGIIDMFFLPQYINTIQTTSPHILRYLATAVVTNKKRRASLKDLVRVVKEEHAAGRYSDPVTEFVEALYVRYDFQAAQEKLKECEEVLFNDFFLVATRDDFVETARLFIFETYARIHGRIDLGKISLLLGLEKESGEKWMVNLIRNARLDGKVDAETNTVIMGAPQTSVYQQIIERTKALSFRSSVLLNALDKRVVERREEVEVEA